MAYEQNNINRYNKEENKKVVAFISALPETEEENDEENSDGTTLINCGVRYMLRKKK